MWPGVVVVTDETPMFFEEVRLHFIGFMESFYFTTGCWPTHTCGYMFNSQLMAVHIKRWSSASSRLKLSPLIRKNLRRNPKPPNSPIQKQHRVLPGWTINLNRPRNEPWMVILITNHPIVVAAELKISLPQSIAVFSLETFGSPSLSRLTNWVI